MKTGNGFTPVADLLGTTVGRPPELGAVNLRVLTPFQRALLVIDGTVTRFIEAYTMEPMDIVRLGQAEQVLEEDHRWLETPRGTAVSVRRVLIEGRYTRTPYLHAASLVVLDRLPDAVRRGLDIEGGGIGQILNDCAIETRREVLWFGLDRATEPSEKALRRTDGEFVTRTYRIIARTRPIALITERFPLEIDRLPSPH